MSILFKKLFHFTICLIFLDKFISKNLTTPILSNNQLFFVNLKIGTLDQNLLLMIDILTNSSWLATDKSSLFYSNSNDSLIKPNIDSLLSQKKLDFKANSRPQFSRFTGNGFLFQDQFKFENNSNYFVFNMFASDNYLSDIESNGILGMDFKHNINFEGCNILQSLLIQDLILNNSFIIEFHPSKNLNLILGSANLTYRSDLEYSKCRVINLTSDTLGYDNNSNFHWSCELNRLFAGPIEDYYEGVSIEHPIVFSSTTNGIIMSEQFKSFFSLYYFYGYTLNQCIERELGETIFYLCLKDFNYTYLPNLNFDIDGWVYTFNYTQLFDPSPPIDFYRELSYSIQINDPFYEKYNFFKVRFVSLKSQVKMNETIFGIGIFKDSIVFDQDNREIGFYYKNKTLKRTIKVTTMGFNLILFVIIFFSIFGFIIIASIVGYFIFLKFKERRVEYKVEFDENVDKPYDIDEENNENSDQV